MTVTTQRRRQAQVATSVQPQQRQTPSSRVAARQARKEEAAVDSGSTVVSSLKASLVGGFGIVILMLIGLIPPPENLPFVSLAFLVIPGYLVVCLATGLLAGIFAGDSVKNSQQGGKVGWMAGFWAGIFGGIVAMLLAAGSMLLINFGQGVVLQFTPAWLETLSGYGLSAANIALAGRVFGALIIYGVIGALVSGLFSSIGGMIYPKLSAQQ